MSEENIGLGILFFVAFVLLPIGLPTLFVVIKVRGKKKIRELGYELLSYGDGGALTANYYSLCLKDGIVYIFHGSDVKSAVPIEVIGISEITQNARLVQLEMRYRENGMVRSTRFKGNEDQLLTIADRLGYGG